jgi:hypothetical protein
MKTALVTILIIMLISTPTIPNISALTNTSFGGKPGDWIDYQLQDILMGQAIEYERIDFLNDTGTQLTLRVAVYTQTMTESNDTLTIDLTTTQDVTMRFFTIRTYIVPGGLNVNNSVYLGTMFGNRTIQGETGISYLGVTRTVVYANFSDTAENNYLFYWDKITGVLTEAIESRNGSSLNTVVVNDTNMWVSPIPSLIWIGIIAAIVLGVLTSQKSIRKRLHRKPEQKTPPSKEVPSKT